MIRFRKDGSLAALHRGAGQLPQCPGGAPEDHVRPRHLRAPQAAGRQDQVQEVRPARHRAARGDDPHRRRRRGRRDADPGRRRADPAGQAGPAADQPGALKEAVRSPMACSSSAARPAPARPPRCTRCSATSTPPDTKIWTAEDPVEITQKGLRQVQVNRRPAGPSPP
jgi:hypothetical protein